jgi:hypothetical protein
MEYTHYNFIREMNEVCTIVFNGTYFGPVRSVLLLLFLFNCALVFREDTVRCPKVGI